MTTREPLLRAALRVIGEHGVGGLTNRLVAKEAGVSLGSLTYHFASQTELLREALLLFVTDEADRIGTIARTLGDTVHDLPGAAEAAQRALAEIALGRTEIGVYELYLQSARDPELHEAARRCFAAYDEVAIAILTSLGIAQPEQVAPHVVALIAGTQLRRLATDEPGHEHLAEGLLLLLGGTTDAGTA